MPTLAAPQRLRRADPDTLHSLHGTSMGTHWRVRVGRSAVFAAADPAQRHQDVLASVVRHMSHWQADSTLAQFNRAPADTWHALPADLSTVLHAGLHWAQASGGAFDPRRGGAGGRLGLWPARSPHTLPIGGPPARTPSLRHKRAAAGNASLTTRNAAGDNTAACSWI